MVSSNTGVSRIAWLGPWNFFIFVIKAGNHHPKKLDFEKAFDKVEHNLMLKFMDKKGFPSRWLSWMQLIFNSGTSSILLNGGQGRFFIIREGLGRVTLYPPSCLS
jgi:hypothetical protein